MSHTCLKKQRQSKQVLSQEYTLQNKGDDCLTVFCKGLVKSGTTLSVLGRPWLSNRAFRNNHHKCREQAATQPSRGVSEVTRLNLQMWAAVQTRSHISPLLLQEVELESMVIVIEKMSTIHLLERKFKQLWQSNNGMGQLTKLWALYREKQTCCHIEATPLYILATEDVFSLRHSKTSENGSN